MAPPRLRLKSASALRPPAANAATAASRSRSASALASVEGAVGAPRQARDLLHRSGGDGFAALVKHEHRHAENPQFAREPGEFVHPFLDAVAHEHDRLDAARSRLCDGMAQHAPDLGLARRAGYRRHPANQVGSGRSEEHTSELQSH